MYFNTIYSILTSYLIFLQGFIKITGRTKEIIITAGAENIAPLAIEGEMKNEMPAISNCLIIGDKRKYLTMLVSLRCDVDVETNIPTDNLAPMSLHVGKEIGSNATTMSEAAQDPLWIEYIDQGMARANTRAGKICTPTPPYDLYLHQAICAAL